MRKEKWLSLLPHFREVSMLRGSIVKKLGFGMSGDRFQIYLVTHIEEVVYGGKVWASKLGLT